MRFYFTMTEIADMLGWRTERARNWLKRSNAVVKRNGRWVTTRRLLLATFPEILDELTLYNKPDPARHHPVDPRRPAG